MMLETLYLACFCIGLVLCVLSFIGGIGHLHLGGLHGVHLHVHAPHAGHGNAVGYVNGFTLTGFLCWFGGIGYLLTRQHTFAALLVVLFAALAGIAGAAAILFFLVKVLLPHERALLPQDTEMRGVLARVTGAMQPGHMGEILFTLNGTRRSAAARSENDVPIPKGSPVLVLAYRSGIATVRLCTELEALDAHTTPLLSVDRSGSAH